MKRRISRAILGAVAAGALVVSGTGVAAQARPGANSEPGQATIPQRYLDQQVNWVTCSFDATVKRLYPPAPTTRCANITVPMDWNHPDDHPDITLAVAYSEATGTSKGLLTTNPGGPGGAGVTMSAALAISKTQMFSDYDLLGFDPRGFGNSTNVSCLVDSAELDALPTTPDYRERTALTHEVEIAEAKLLAKACSSTEFSQFVNTQQTVYDMDFLRALMGAPKLNYIGYSYGTWLGTWYADTYPERVGKFIIDSNMNWVGDMYDNQTTDSLSFQRRRDAMLFPWIARHNDEYGLGTSAKAVSQRYEEIRAKLVANTKAGLESPRADDLDVAVLEPIYTDAGFAEAAEAIIAMGEAAEAASPLSKAGQAAVDRATAGQLDSTRSLIAQARAKAKSTGDEVVNLGAYGTVVRCNDTPYTGSPQSYVKAADRDAAKYSFIGYFNTVGMCNYWPFQQQPRRIDLVNSPTLLMFQAEGDPATATEGALAAHRATKRHTVFVGITEEGQHGQYIDGPSPCVEAIGDEFLFGGGSLPADMTMCATTPLPGDSEVFPLAGPFDRMQGRTGHQKKSQPNPMLTEARKQAAGL